MAKTTHISIFADCTIRDIFGICDLEQKYVIDTNISSIHPFSVNDKKIIEYSRIGGVEREEKEIFGKLESFFVRNIKLDLTKNFDGISGENSEFLLFHMSNIRFGLFRDLHDEGRRLTCVTRRDKWFNYIGNLSKRNFLPKEYEIMEAYELCEDEFYGYIDDFMEKLLRNFQEEQLILFEVYLSDDMVSAEKKNTSIPPIRRPITTLGSRMLIENCDALSAELVLSANDENRARAVRAADPIANPLPIAAVVLPTASSLSVMLRTLSSSSLISAIPPALSAIGP